MSFKISKIAVAASVAVVAGSALATPQNPNVPLSNYSTNTSHIYLAGSSAVDLALTKFLAATCDAGTLDTYRTDAATGSPAVGKTWYLWTCSVKSKQSTYGFPNSQIAIHKYTNSSSDGVNLVNKTNTAAFLQASDLSSCNVAGTTVPATTNLSEYHYYSCGTNAGTAGVGTLTANVQFGFSDAEPSQFGASGNLTSVYPITLVFGVPVTENVRNALQAAQGLTVGDETSANMPTLSVDTINAIFTGNLSNWSQLGLNVADDNIYVAERSSGSGTTRTFDATFLGDFCNGSLQGLATSRLIKVATTNISSACNVASDEATAGGTQPQLGTSDDMAACLTSFNTNNVGAIGYLSTDYQPVVGTDGYRFVKIDGYTPSVLNVFNNKYHDWNEESMNFNVANVTVTTKNTDTYGFFQMMHTGSTNPAVLADMLQGLSQASGWTGAVLGAVPTTYGSTTFGFSADATLSTTAGRTEAQVLALPGNPFTHFNSATSKRSTCFHPQLDSNLAAYANN